MKETSKSITQAELDKSLKQQAESYIGVLDEKESTINKVQWVLSVVITHFL